LKKVTWLYKPEGRKGIQLGKREYTLLSMFILNAALNSSTLVMAELLAMAEKEMSEVLDNEIAWNTLQVKLDMEARQYIRVVPAPHNKRIQHIKITREGKKYLQELEKNSED
jgi:DNA-binding MarR family transcriptional regulator